MLYIIIQREKKRWDFVTASYYSIQVLLSNQPPSTFNSKKQKQKQTDNSVYLSCNLYTIDKKRIANEKDFDPKTGFLKEMSTEKKPNSVEKRPFLLTPENIEGIMTWVNSTETAMKIDQIDRKLTQKSPNLPFITSTLQQEASRRLYTSPSVTMRLAQVD